MGSVRCRQVARRCGTVLYCETTNVDNTIRRTRLLDSSGCFAFNFRTRWGISPLFVTCGRSATLTEFITPFIVVMHRSRGVIHRRRGVCGEAEVGHQILLAPFVAVIGAFAATAEVITDSCGKNTLTADTRKHCIRNGNSHFLACGKQKLETRHKNHPHTFSSHAHP